jgi:cytochrome b561
VRQAGALHRTLHGLRLIVPVLGYFTTTTTPTRVPILFPRAIPAQHHVA